MWYFIKNNVKLIYRSRVLFVMLIILPVLLIALLSDTFSAFLETNKKLESFRAGYSCEDNSYMKEMLDEFINVCEKEGITLTQINEETGVRLVREDDLDTYVSFKENDYKLYQGKNKESCGMILDSMVASFATTYGQQRIAQVNETTLPQNTSSSVEVTKIKIDPIPNAKTYYGIVEILYMMWCGIISIAAIYISEQKHKVQKRYYISTMSSLKFYLGKLFAGAFALCVQMGVAIGISIVFLDIDWGDVFYKSAGLLLLLSLAVSSVSILLYQLLRHTAAVLAIEFFFVFIFGFLGGSFQTYFYSSISEEIAKWSPQYYLNRTMVEFATKGSSEYTYISIAILGSFLLVCSVASLLLVKGRREA